MGCWEGGIMGGRNMIEWWREVGLSEEELRFARRLGAFGMIV
jgi:hypothetical protein